MTAASLSLATWLLALFSISLSAAAQLLMKVGMTNLRSANALQTLSAESITQVVFNPWVFSGLFCYAVSAAFWLVVLSKMPLSLAYPLISLGIAAVVILSSALLQEAIGPMRMAGVALIVTGVIFIGRS